MTLNVRPKERSFDRAKGNKDEIHSLLSITCEGGNRPEWLKSREEFKKEKSEEMHSVQSVLGPLAVAQERMERLDGIHSVLIEIPWPQCEETLIKR